MKDNIHDKNNKKTVIKIDPFVPKNLPTNPDKSEPNNGKKIINKYIYYYYPFIEFI